MQNISHIVDYVRRGERLTVEDAVTLWRHAPLWLLGELATARKRAESGEVVYYNRNIHIEPSNICIFNCEFCSFRRRQGDADAWSMTLDEVEERAAKMRGTGITEVHIVGGVHPDHTLDSYCEMIRRVKRALPEVAVKAYTAVEILYMIRRAELTLDEGMQRLKDAGMESIPGGGAEIFDEELRSKLCPDKCSSEEWLEVHRTAHKLGIPTNCTMLYGHVESIEQRVDHLDRLRKLQDEAPGFNAFIPLKYRSRNNRMSEIGECSVEEDMRTIAMSRIFLDNIPHIKAYWVAYGKSVTEMALAFGADDIDGTIDDSTKIYSMAGADARPSMSVAELESLVHDAGFVAVERDTHYRELRRSALSEGEVSTKPKLAEPVVRDANRADDAKEKKEDKKRDNKMKKQKKMGKQESTAAQPASRSEVDTTKGGAKAAESGFMRAYKRHIVLFNMMFVGLFGIAVVLLVYFGLMLGTRHNKSIVVPNFIEMNLEDARKVAEDLNLEIVVRDSVYETDIDGGMVIDQMPAPSTVREVTVKPDRKIYLTVNAYARRQVKVPYVGHMPIRQALNQLERDGFRIKELVYRQHHHSDMVLDQSVGGRTITRSTNITMPYGSPVTLHVGYRADKHITSVPRLMGMRLHQAQSALWASGLNVNKIVYDETVSDLKSRRIARVYMQTQPAKKGVARGTKVSLYLTCDEQLIDSLSKISDKNAKYLEKQRLLMEQEAQEEARLKEEQERLAAEEQARLEAEAAANAEGGEAVEGSTQTDGAQAAGAEVEAQAAVEAAKVDDGAKASTTTTSDDVVEDVDDEFAL